jgi:hypothetical protein
MVLVSIVILDHYSEGRDIQYQKKNKTSAKLLLCWSETQDSAIYEI